MTATVRKIHGYNQKNAQELVNPQRLKTRTIEDHKSRLVQNDTGQPKKVKYCKLHKTCKNKEDINTNNIHINIRVET